MPPPGHTQCTEDFEFRHQERSQTLPVVFATAARGEYLTRLIPRDWHGIAVRDPGPDVQTSRVWQAPATSLTTQTTAMFDKGLTLTACRYSRASPHLHQGVETLRSLPAEAQGRNVFFVRSFVAAGRAPRAPKCQCERLRAEKRGRFGLNRVGLDCELDRTNHRN